LQDFGRTLLTQRPAEVFLESPQRQSTKTAPAPRHSIEIQAAAAHREWPNVSSELIFFPELAEIAPICGLAATQMAENRQITRVDSRALSTNRSNLFKVFLFELIRTRERN
jgi:hypothetical protein